MGTNLRATGTLPAALSGQYAQIDPIGGTVHTVTLDAGNANAYRNRRLDADVAATNVVAFGRSILALGDGALAHELSPQLDTIRPVDLAGACRTLVAHAKVDPHTGELHLLTSSTAPSQLHVAVSRGGLTRTTKSIDDAPGR